MERTLDKVCSFRRGLLRRRLNAKFIFGVVFFFIAPVTIIFYQASHFDLVHILSKVSVFLKELMTG